MKTEKRRKRLRRLYAVAVLLLLAPVVCQAEIITIGIKAQVGFVSDPAGYLGGAIAQNDYLTGYYMFDSLTPDSNPSSIGGRYDYSASPFGMWVSANGLTFGTNPDHTEFSIRVTNNSDQPSPYDYYIVVAGEESSLLPLDNGTAVTAMYWQLDDSTASALLSDALPTTAPLLTAWNDGNYLRISGGPRDTEFAIGADVTEAWIVPEPLSALLLAFGLPFTRRLCR
jgi:hypothetical protein